MCAGALEIAIVIQGALSVLAFSDVGQESFSEQFHIFPDNFGKFPFIIFRKISNIYPTI